MGWPFIGETLELIIPSYSLDLPPFIKTRVQKYGPVFRTCLAGQAIAISADREFNNYLFVNEGKLVELWTNLLRKFQDLSNGTLHSWSSSMADIQITEAISIMIFDFTADHLFGYKHDDDDEHSSTSVIINPEIFTSALEGLMSVPLNIPGTKFHKCMKNKETAFNFLKGLLNKRKASISSGETRRGDFLDQLIEELEKGSILKEEVAIHIMYGIVIATVEPIGRVLTLAFKFLSETPSAIQQLIEEHEDILKSRAGISDSSSLLSWAEYKSLTFTDQVINEILRINNHMPGVLRRALTDIQVEGGYIIPAGWTIILVTPALHLNPDSFNDPLMFNPWRWKDLDPQFVHKHFMPFGLGRRQCAGADFTRVLLTAFLHVLVTKYSWTMVKEGVISRDPVLNLGHDFYINFSHKVE
ncbi:hypothetical protein ACFE04_027962 [Oxalis oulophora]